MIGVRDAFGRGWSWVLASAKFHRFLLLSVSFPLLLRAVPEILAGPWPLGFDTVGWYGPFIKDVEGRGLEFGLQSVGRDQVAPGMFVLFGLAAQITHAPPFVITKVAAPLLYSFLGFSLYYFARKGLRWDGRKSFLIVLVSALYFVSLRFSWDMYKNTLGYAFFLLALTRLGNPQRLRETFVLLTLTGLCALASEFTSTLLTMMALLLFGWERAKARRWDVPALLVAGICGVATLYYGHLLLAQPSLPTPLAPFQQSGGILYNYVGLEEGGFVYKDLSDIYLSVLTLATVLFLPVAPFAVYGFFKERRLLLWSFTLVVGSFSIAVYPFAAIPFWHRWLMMLVFPTLFFATAGAIKAGRRVLVTFIGLLTVMAVAYVALPPDSALPYYTMPQALRYVPSSMMQNTIPILDCPDVVRVASWIDSQNISSGVLVENIRFYGWARLLVESMPAYLFENPHQVNRGDFSQYSHVYLIDFSRGRSWFREDLLPANATVVFTSGDISVYEIVR
jgi:hypothetical protein